ncbi:tyrosine-type recombinase/integrase [Actinomadura sp. ATCC 31491]|uniref:Tyrosine-type recombinase/integrase n=1 Tax=Actinomadura luzonensis TaxID=2805427 RepID=A0ABT0G0J3_9ACTN|nr:tyrosine-type recombinase/integrase [Actinomadura luzonensis]MCK2218139.1 tyrosine-type recombinase/integrase [Actinomadura luzonensis]
MRQTHRALKVTTYAGLDLHQLRHSAATHLGEAEVPLQLITGKTRHKNPRTAMRYVKLGAEAIAKVTEVLAPRRRTHWSIRCP